MNHLRDFAEQINKAPLDRTAEKIVRCMIEEVARDCPMALLQQLGQSILDFRKAEVRDEPPS